MQNGAYVTGGGGSDGDRDRGGRRRRGIGGRQTSIMDYTEKCLLVQLQCQTGRKVLGVSFRIRKKILPKPQFGQRPVSWFRVTGAAGAYT
ncbi:hypothetical protein M0802_001618 [Mischocyttarus mexicanus]|nr:hypothetical protein M0802_001618 [Mischocyttarus mexicanus]